MRGPVKRLLRYVVKNDFTWRMIDATIIPLSNYCQWQREKIKLYQNMNIDRDAIKSLSDEMVVRNGPFKGMKYPKISEGEIMLLPNGGGTFLPKLLGSYEREIQPVIERICQTEYTEVIDVGCADGYYAVGLALNMKSARIYAFDTEERARVLCRRLVKVNGVGDSVHVHGSFSSDRLINFPFTGRGLILCDCEGFEKELFTKEVVPSLVNCDLLIELHDSIDINISSYILSLFSRTHDQFIIESIDDIRKAKTYCFSELEGLNLETKKYILRERRASIMEWVFLQSKRSRTKNEQ
ncbi:hypothetical protein ISS37_03830 [candidate division KSB1 bacterium]|nr:hypothetical protein [candidate division KSB1 bacterium]